MKTLFIVLGMMLSGLASASTGSIEGLAGKYTGRPEMFIYKPCKVEVSYNENYRRYTIKITNTFKLLGSLSESFEISEHEINESSDPSTVSKDFKEAGYFYGKQYTGTLKFSAGKLTDAYVIGVEQGIRGRDSDIDVSCEKLKKD